jgi:membrane associated rhomboid family serine protease
VHCGAPIAQPAPSGDTATEYHFLRALFTRSNPFTMIFIGLNVGVFVLMCLAGGFSVMSVDPEVLRGFGAKQNDLIAEQHQYWRLITSIFIHIGLIHLVLNNYALWIIGQEIEQIYGSARFVVLYLATGVIGSAGSYVFNPQATSAGASGAIFGLFGVMATFAFRYRREIPQMLSREIRRRVLPIIAINLAFGFSVRIVDNAAHIGGLLSGIALALAVPYMRPSERITPILWRALQTVCLALIFVSFVGAFRNYNGPRLALANITRRPGSGIVEYFDRMQEGNQILVGSFNSFEAIVNDRNGAGDVKRAVANVERGIRAVDAVPRVDPQADQYRAHLLELLTQQKKILNEFSQSIPDNRNRDNLLKEENGLKDQTEQFLADYSSWLPGFLKQHGYELGQRNGD